MFKDCILNNVKKLEKELLKIAEDEFNSLDIHPTYGYIMTVVASQDYVG